MKHLVFLVLVFLSNYIIGQNYNNVAIKEKYDIFNQQIINSYSPCTIDPDNDAGTFGDGLSKILDGYITMYKTTKDKAYLYKFIIQSICVLENRHDFAGINSTPRWAYDPQMYQDSYIIASMAHFVYFINKEETDLSTLELYPFPQIINNNFGQTFTTFGQFANWLGYRVEETLDWFLSNGYWDNSWGFKKTPDSESAVELNMQVGFATTLLFMGLSDPNSYYLQKANTIANLIKGNVNFYDPCEDKFYNSPVLRTGNNNSYWWYHNGWGIPKRGCWDAAWWPPHATYYSNAPNYNGYTQYIEDLSHGAIDTWHFLYYYLYLPNSPLTETDMIRLHNTYTQKINKNGQIHTGVDGSYNTYLESRPDYTQSIINQIKKSNSMNYMLFQSWDNYLNSYGNIYNTTMDYYLNYVNPYENRPSDYYGGQGNRGHSFIVEAQWQNDCPNLTLYNRKVVYDQDFFSKGTLTIAPQESTSNSYADPEISDQKFTVEPGVTVNMVASKAIIMKPGTHIKAGSHFRAYIDPNLCSNNKSSKNNIAKNSNNKYNEITSKNTIENDSIYSFSISNELSIFPNPFSEYTIIQFSLSKKSIVTLTVTDNYGRIIFNKISNRELKEGIYNIPFSGSNLNNGIYICILDIDNKTRLTKKMIKQ